MKKLLGGFLALTLLGSLSSTVFADGYRHHRHQDGSGNGSGGGTPSPTPVPVPAPAPAPTPAPVTSGTLNYICTSGGGATQRDPFTLQFLNGGASAIITDPYFIAQIGGNATAPCSYPALPPSNLPGATILNYGDAINSISCGSGFWIQVNTGNTGIGNTVIDINFFAAVGPGQQASPIGGILCNLQ